ncbi:mercuric transport protein MerTP [Pedobacter nutrimenti]|uniref:Mercuric transport protein MerT n=1 Tax=Pedobacter nutrimenti TaxID=1241337 RepID=A0A318UE22_9SPHI|nr:mercuric transport protein MerTP [Pedobacter nutrimenti]PYF74644.1 copper chaperone CopZ [Pedobacter nutrimenti]
MSKAKYNNKLLGSGILLALTSSMCCIMPMLALFGTAGSAVTMFSWVAPLRPYLLAATVLILGVTFYQAYKPVAKDDCGCAERRTGMQSKSFLWIVTILSIGFSTFPYYGPYFQKNVQRQSKANISNVQQTVIQIQGMSCAACEGHVNRALQERKGVQEVTTSYAKGESVVKFDSTQISIRQLANTIQSETGYKVTNVKTDVN